MNNAQILLEALRTLNRPATRAEIECESGLDYDQVHTALRTLIRHGVLLKLVDAPRRRGLYQLVEAAGDLETTRGRYERDELHRQRVAALVRAHRAGQAVPSYSPARPPSHAAAAGITRMIVRGVLDLRQQSRAGFGICALAEIWKKR